MPLGGYEWRPDLSATDGDPRFIAESVANAASYLGLESVVMMSLLLYLTPLFLFGVVSSVVCYLKHKSILVKWPDLLLLVLPVAVWLVLVLVYPVGKPFSSILDLSVLGLLAGATFLLRYFTSEAMRAATARLGLLSVTSAAVLFWAFMPEWTVFS